MKIQVYAHKCIEAQRPEIEGLMDIHTFEFIFKTNLPAKTRYLDLIWTYRRKRRPDGSLKKYKARICVNDSRQIHCRVCIHRLLLVGAMKSGQPCIHIFQGGV
jgi:hypothetical protein